MDFYKPKNIHTDQINKIISFLLDEKIPKPKSLGAKKISLYWNKVLKWFKKYKPKDEGVMFMWESLFTNKYLQSKYMYKEMLKRVLYLYRYYHDPTFPYEYDSDLIKGIQHIWETEFFFSQGPFANKNFKLEPNQVYKLFLIYGFTIKNDFMTDDFKGKGIKFISNKIYDVETRKQGKSEFYAGLGVFIQQNFFGNDAQPSIFSTGPILSASEIITNKAKDFVQANSNLLARYKKISTKKFETLQKGKFTSLAFEKKGLEGGAPSLLIATEYHLHDNEKMVESAESAESMVRVNPLIVFDTTKGTGIYGVAFTREHKYKDLLDEQLCNPDKIIASNIATFIAELDEEDRYEQFYDKYETNPLRKSTPMLGVTVSLDSLKSQWTEAKTNPVSRREFLIKKAGRWIGHSTAMFELKDLSDCDNEYKNMGYSIDKIKGSPAILSVDLANTNDTNAVLLTFKDKVGEDYIPLFHAHNWIPRDTLEERITKEQKPYLEWIEAGWISVSGKRTVDHRDIAAYILEMIEAYQIPKIYYDPYQFHIIKTYLTDRYPELDGIFEPEKQTAANLSSPLEDLIKRIVDIKMYYFGNPVFADHFLGWTPRFNSTGQIYYVKVDQKQRIDIVATCIMAMKHFPDLKAIGETNSPSVEVMLF